jgi:hypothetical protein
LTILKVEKELIMTQITIRTYGSKIIEKNPWKKEMLHKKSIRILPQCVRKSHHRIQTIV